MHFQILSKKLSSQISNTAYLRQFPPELTLKKVTCELAYNIVK